MAESPDTSTRTLGSRSFFTSVALSGILTVVPLAISGGVNSIAWEKSMSKEDENNVTLPPTGLVSCMYWLCRFDGKVNDGEVIDAVDTEPDTVGVDRTSRFEPTRRGDRNFRTPFFLLAGDDKSFDVADAAVEVDDEGFGVAELETDITLLSSRDDSATMDN